MFEDKRLAMQDPRTQYPQPPFKKQPQTAPGLAEKMNPIPDHGETSYKGSGKLKGRKALITGGDSGIGRAAAIAFAREGADVAIVYLPSEEPDAKEVIELIEKSGQKALALPGDITNEAFCKSLVESTVKEFGGLDILVNNAGKQVSTEDMLEISDEQFDLTLKTNLYAMFWITKAAVPHMPPGSSIICTTSVQGYHPSSDLVDYGITKAGIADFAKSMSKQMIKKGIRVNAVAPGPFWTPLQTSGGDSEEKVHTFGETSTFGRPGQPVEIAPIYVLLASQEGSYFTGEVIGVTGGTGVA